jgi:hypothetical protein
VFIVAGRKRSVAFEKIEIELVLADIDTGVDCGK